MSVPSHFGRYRVLRPLATGEMGAVYLAEDPLIGRLLAIKGIRFDAYADDDEIRRLQTRFDQEIQIAGTFSHPNIVTLYDVGRQGSRPFIAMEFVDGRNLRAELQANGPLPAARAVGLIAPICRALTYAHERKIIHRDVKPTNILVSNEGVPKITDFGVARLFGSTLTNAGKIFGTPAYMSPEQARGAKLTGASDQFAAAAVLYELLTGERPFKGSSPTAVIYEVIENDPPPPHELAPLVPTAVSAAVMRGMSKTPEQRFESCAALAEALEAAVAWSKANPALAYFDARSENALATGTGESLFGHSAALENLWKRACRLADAAATADVWSEVRSAALRITRDSRSLAKLAAATLSLVTLLSVVAWAASTSGPSTRLTPRAQPADLMADAVRPERGVPLTGAPRRASDDAATPDDAAGEGPASTAAPEAGNLRVVFVVATRPQGARVTFDGEVLGESAPVSIRLTDDRRHTLRLEAEGYEPLAWSFSRDQLSATHLETGELYFPLQPFVTAGIGEDEAAETSSPTAADTPLSDNVPTSAGAAPEDDWLGYGVSGPPPSPSDIRIVRAPAQTPAPEKIRHVDLTLPAGAVADGVVVLEIEVSARGNVVQARVLRGLDPVVDQAALDAVVRWKYRPTALSGEPVHVLMTVTLPVRRSDGR